MIAYRPEAWADLPEAVAASAAALAGLIFVATSIKLKAILDAAILPLRAAEALLVLVSFVLLAILLLDSARRDPPLDVPTGTGWSGG